MTPKLCIYRSALRRGLAMYRIYVLLKRHSLSNKNAVCWRSVFKSAQSNTNTLLRYTTRQLQRRRAAQQVELLSRGGNVIRGRAVHHEEY